MNDKITCHPLTPERWADVEKLFGSRGACAGCWCMWFKRSRKEFDAARGEKNRRAFRKIVATGPPPGLLAYAGDEPVGWCAAEPRENYGGLARSRVFAPVDDRPAWAVTCFFVAKGWRRRGVTVALLRAAVEHVRAQGGRIIEGCPVDTDGKKYTDTFAYVGAAEAFRRAGFREVARRSPTRPVMRLEIARSK